MSKFYEFKNELSEDTAELSIFNEIGFWGTSAKAFREQLKSIKAKTIVVDINSPGGNVIDGIAIYNGLRSHGARINVKVSGVAASIASLIAMAGDSVEMPANTFMFLHSPLVGHAEGNAEKLRETADTLDKLEKSIVATYATKTKKDTKTIEKWLDEESLFSAEECLAHGLADKVTDKVNAKACYDITAHFPTLANIVDKLPTDAGASSGANKTTDTDMSKELTDKIASLETTVASAQTAQAKAVLEAQNKIKEDEKARKTALAAFAKKHDKDGDLTPALNDALAGETTLDEFKDKVLEVVAKRGTKEAITPQGGGEPNGAEAKTLVEQYKATKAGTKERRTLVRENLKEIRALLRTGAISEAE
jgi:ATP-dependent protease ClpP protease subunit